MPSFQTRRTVPFTPRQMFDVVADVEQYPKFLPLVEGLRIHATQRNEDTTTLTATMEVGFKAIRESVKTKVDLNPVKMQIDVAYLDGPFQHLESRWQFLDHAKGCDVDFFIDYEFRSAMLAMIMGAMFEQAFRKFSQSFEERAAKIYR